MKFATSLLAATLVAGAQAQLNCVGTECNVYAGYQTSSDVSGYAAFAQDGTRASSLKSTSPSSSSSPACCFVYFADFYGWKSSLLVAASARAIVVFLAVFKAL
jgi:hypothetical protein